jgi:hypothetical protein
VTFPPGAGMSFVHNRVPNEADFRLIAQTVLYDTEVVVPIPPKVVAVLPNNMSLSIAHLIAEPVGKVGIVTFQEYESRRVEL